MKKQINAELRRHSTYGALTYSMIVETYLIKVVVEVWMLRVARVHGQPHEVVVGRRGGRRRGGRRGAAGRAARRARRRARRRRATLAVALVAALCTLCVHKDNIIL